MAILGLRGTENLATGERPKSWREGYVHIFPNGDAKLTALLSKGENEALSDAEFSWFEKKLPELRVLVNNGGGYTATAAAIAVDDGAGGSASFNLKAGTMLMNERTFEHMIVTTDPTTDTIAVQRGKGSTAAAAINDNDALQVIGSVYEDGSTAKVSAVMFDPIARVNYSQIFIDTLEMTRRTMKTALRTGDKYLETKRETLQMHMMGLERAMFFGEPLNEAGSRPEVRRTATGGMMYWAKTNVHDAGGNLTFFELMDFVEQDFRYGSQEKAMFCGSIFLNAFNKLASLQHTINTVPGDQTLGINMREVITPHGSLYLIQHPLFTISSTFRSWGFLVDLANVKFRHFDDTIFIEHTQENHVKRRSDEYYTDCGAEWHEEESHAIWKNVTGAA